MPKNIGLGLVLKRSFRTRELITLLNNLGHSVSYDDIVRIDTTCAAGILEVNDGYSTVPTNIREKFLFKPSLIMEITVNKTTQHETISISRTISIYRPVSISRTLRVICSQYNTIFMIYINIYDYQYNSFMDITNYTY